MDDHALEQQAWAWAELRDVQLGDARLVQRLVRITQTLSQNPEESIPHAFGPWSETKAVYRFLDNDEVDPHEILQAHRGATLRRIVAADSPLILIVQDTSQFDFTQHHATAGFGPTGAPGLSGFFLHSSLAVLPGDGTPLGLLASQWWVREETKRGQRNDKRAIKDKESGRWLQAMAESTADLPAQVRTLTVADREADIFEFLHYAQEMNRPVLVRAHHDRRVAVDGELHGLWQAATSALVLGRVTFTVPRADKRPERQATATLQVAEVEMAAPRHLAARHLPSVHVRAILLQEADAPPDQDPVQWLLLTSLPVRTAAEAQQCLTWYTYRWRIERFHFTLKSGGNYEKLQLQTAERLWRALAVYCVVAWRVLYIDLAARTHPQAPCTTFLTQDEWQALVCHHRKTPVPPAEPPDARTAVRWIAMLGGFLGRKGDGEPGVKTLWRGFRRLQDLTEMWRLLRPRE